MFKRLGKTGLFYLGDFIGFLSILLNVRYYIKIVSSNINKWISRFPLIF